MNKKTLLLIICLFILVLGLFALKFWLLKKEIPLLPEIIPSPAEQLSPTPTVNPFLLPSPKITPTTTEEPLPTLTETLLPSPTQKVVFYPTIIPSTKEAAIKLLPVINDGYTIEYLSTSGKFFVSILNPPLEQNLEKAKKWFEAQGINPQHQDIVWNISRRLNPKTP